MDTIAVPYLFWVLGLLPAFGVISLHYVPKNKRPRKKKGYLIGTLLLAVLFVFTLAAAEAEKIVLFPSKAPSAMAWTCGAVFLAAVLGWLKFRWPSVSPERRERLRQLLPETHREFLLWIPVSLLAGISEECACRRTAFELLVLIAGSARFALAACVICFAAAHLYQGWKAAAGIGLLGLLSHLAVFLTGGLYLSIVVHAVYDLLVGWVAMRQLSRPDIAPMHAETVVPSGIRTRSHFDRLKFKRAKTPDLPQPPLTRN
jgi:membrane protease YdiL (CAAX protease family)